MSKIEVVCEPNGEYRATVVLFHGLGGHGRDTWHVRDNKDEMWPTWIAEDIQGIRVLSVDYDASVTNWRSQPMSMTDRAQNILDQLLLVEKLGSKPVILIGHSLGGLLIKQMIRSLDGNQNGSRRVLLRSIKRVIFIGTPHAGSGFASLMLKTGAFSRPSSLAKVLVSDSPELRDLNQWYRNHSPGKIENTQFAEQKSLKRLGLIVARSSADSGLLGSDPIPVDEDHISITKLANRDSHVYRRILEDINQSIAVDGAPFLADPPEVADRPLASATRRRGSLTSRLSRHSSSLVETGKDRPFTVLICAPEMVAEKPNRTNRLLSEFKSQLESEDFEVILGEDAGLGNGLLHKGETPLVGETEFIKRSCNAVIVIADSIGTWCEVGTFGTTLITEKTVRENGTDFIVLLDESYRGTNRLLMGGPVAMFEAFGMAKFVDLSTHNPSEIVSRLRARRSVYTKDRRGRPRASAS